ncbi:hypothetical protein VPH35_110602 [Triticum aestivum]|uniref:uncharacterized protein n=1 Tax=Triticum aestivum TaxID=4565 RepID=UPI001D008007|nr:uncharacterized protein LOC123136887 [Triticum aestivum]
MVAQRRSWLVPRRLFRAPLFLAPPRRPCLCHGLRPPSPHHPRSCLLSCHRAALASSPLRRLPLSATAWPPSLPPLVSFFTQHLQDDASPSSISRCGAPWFLTGRRSRRRGGRRWGEGRARPGLGRRRGAAADRAQVRRGWWCSGFKACITWTWSERGTRAWDKVTVTGTASQKKVLRAARRTRKLAHTPPPLALVSVRLLSSCFLLDLPIDLVLLLYCVLVLFV